MTTDERAAIRARAEAATPGPWWRVSDRPDGHPLFFDGNGCDLIMSGVDPDTSDCDDRFVIAARTDVPALLDHADAQDRRVAELEANQQEARRLLIEANPLIFGADGRVDHGVPLAGVAAQCAEKIIHMRRLNAEAVAEAERLAQRTAELEVLVRSLSERVHKQSELLSRRAEVQVP